MVTINSVDIKSTYGAIIVQGGLNSLISWPDSKGIVFNDWAEFDGIEPDLSNLYLKSQEINIRFGLTGDATSARSFYNFLTGSSSLNFNDTVNGISRALRVSSISNLDFIRRYSIMNVKFISDDVRKTSASAGSVAWPSDSSYTIDGRPFTDYSVKILNGTIQSVMSEGPMRQSLVVDLSGMDGSLYGKGASSWNNRGNEWSDPTTNVYLTKEQRSITLRCGLKSSNITNAWASYYKLFSDLIKVDTSVQDPIIACRRTLYSQQASKSYNCYYKKQAVRDFVNGPSGVYILFDLTLVVV